MWEAEGRSEGPARETEGGGQAGAGPRTAAKDPKVNGGEIASEGREGRDRQSETRGKR